MNRRYFFEALAAFSAYTSKPALAGVNNNAFTASLPVRICVVGVGGAGCATVSHIRDALPQTTQTIQINCDETSLSKAISHRKILIGGGIQASPNAARDKAIERQPAIAEAMSSIDLVFIVAGMGGTTGTGIAPVIADIAKRAALFTIGVAITPLDFEGDKRKKVAQSGVIDFKSKVDAFYEISNERLALSTDESIQFSTFLRLADRAFMSVYFSTVESLNSTIFTTKSA